MNKTQIEYCYECLHNKNNMTPHRKGYRVCGTCKVEKKYSEFHAKKDNAHGIHFRCKECTKVYNKKMYSSGKARNRGYKNKYNITLKDDKTYPYIIITNEDYPRVEIIRIKNLKKNKNTYFGPYTDVNYLRTVLKTLHQLFPLRTCNFNINSNNSFYIFLTAKKFRMDYK